MLCVVFGAQKRIVAAIFLSPTSFRSTRDGDVEGREGEKHDMVSSAFPATHMDCH
jgi:hypothetical protein